MFTRHTRTVAVFGLVWILFALAAAASVPSQALDVIYNPENRTLEGSMTVTVTEPQPTIYFLLLPNLARDANPYLSPRGLDAQYEQGFEPTELLVSRVVDASGSENATLPVRWLRLPASSR